jgi:hypothetical protein
MGVRELFSSIFAVLFRFRMFWSKLKDNPPGDETLLLREYAVAVIALVQLAKFPLIGVPRTAMFYSIANFLIDVGALYLFLGAAAYLLGQSSAKKSTAGIPALFCYSLTPVWIAELFYFAGAWSLPAAAVAMVYAIVINRQGLVSFMGLEPTVSGAVFRNIALLQLLGGGALFLLIRALMRLFNFI